MATPHPCPLHSALPMQHSCGMEWHGMANKARTIPHRMMRCVQQTHHNCPQSTLIQHVGFRATQHLAALLIRSGAGGSSKRSVHCPLSALLPPACSHSWPQTCGCHVPLPILFQPREWEPLLCPDRQVARGIWQVNIEACTEIFLC